MDFTVNLTDTSLTLAADSAVTILLGGANSIQLPNGAVIQPPAGHYWNIDMSKSKRIFLQGTYGPVDIEANGSAYFYVDNL